MTALERQEEDDSSDEGDESKKVQDRVGRWVYYIDGKETTPPPHDDD